MVPGHVGTQTRYYCRVETFHLSAGLWVVLSDELFTSRWLDTATEKFDAISGPLSVRDLDRIL